MNDNNKLGPVQKTIVGVQFLFVAFGATVLVPLLVGMDPSVALFTAGIGTLIFHMVTKGKVPIFLGSSFAFIAPIIKATELYGLPGTLFGLVAVGAVYGVMSALVRFRGVGFIARLFPPIVVGPVIMLIGLSLAGTGVDMAKSHWGLAIVSLITTIIVSMFGKGLLRLIPIFSGIIVGYIAAPSSALSISSPSSMHPGLLCPPLCVPSYVGRPSCSWFPWPSLPLSSTLAMCMPSMRWQVRTLSRIPACTAPCWAMASPVWLLRSSEVLP